MNYQRIQSSIDVRRMRDSHVTIVGGAVGLAADLVRCGLGHLTLVDFDTVSDTNPARQDFLPRDLWRRKTEAAAEHLRRINPGVTVETMHADICTLSDEDVEVSFGHTDLTVWGTDSHHAQARGNLIAQQLGISSIWIGLYAKAAAGEIIHHVPGVTPACYRCICSSRYEAFAAAGPQTGTQQPTSDGGTILDLRLVDAIAGYIAVGILTRGADNRFGQLIDSLGDRNLQQVKIDPEYRLGNRDIFAEYLGDHPANFSFTTIAVPMEPESGCPDCGGHGVAA